MFCTACGNAIPAGATVCPACKKPVNSPPGRSSAESTVQDLLRDTRSAARELVVASARLSKRLAERAGDAARDPGAAARKAGRKVADELDAAAKDIEALLRNL